MCVYVLIVGAFEMNASNGEFATFKRFDKDPLHDGLEGVGF